MKPNEDLWWLWILRAISTAIFAMIALAFPPLTSSLAVYLYGAYLKLDGFVLIGLNANSKVRSSWLLAAGVVAIASGIAILIWPAAEFTALLSTLAVLAVVRGALEAVPPLRTAYSNRERGLRLAVAGLILSFGLLLTVHEHLRVLIGAFAVAASVSAICQLAIGLEQLAKSNQRPAPPRTRSMHQRAPLSGLPI
jgi:uncharacterized membrane protein HdeD (DUF308 family)